MTQKEPRTVDPEAAEYPHLCPMVNNYGFGCWRPAAYVVGYAMGEGPIISACRSHLGMAVDYQSRGSGFPVLVTPVIRERKGSRR